MVDEAVFTEIAGKGEKGNKLSETMRKKADKAAHPNPDPKP